MRLSKELWLPGPRDDLTKVSSFLATLEAGGTHKDSCDACEDVIGGLREAMHLKWQGKTRILYLISDCPPHGNRFTTDAIKKDMKRQLDLQQYQIFDLRIGRPTASFQNAF